MITIYILILEKHLITHWQKSNIIGIELLPLNKPLGDFKTNKL